MTPPPERRSVLAGRGHPLRSIQAASAADESASTAAPPEPTPPPAPAPAPPAGETSATLQAPPLAPERSDDGARRLKGGRKSYAGRATTVTFLSEAEYERVKNAYGARGLREGFPSLNDFMCDAILRVVADLEERFNDGEPFTREQTRRRSR